LALTLVSLVSSSPCPFGDLAERGELPEAGAGKFFAARAEGSHAVERMIHENNIQKRELERQEQYYKRQLDLGELVLGGGLLNGVLQPFTGILKDLDGKSNVAL
jgi:hypothetical protein